MAHVRAYKRLSVYILHFSHFLCTLAGILLGRTRERVCLPARSPAMSLIQTSYGTFSDLIGKFESHSATVVSLGN